MEGEEGDEKWGGGGQMMVQHNLFNLTMNTC